MHEPPSAARQTWRRFTAWYAWALSWLLVVSVGVLIIPVSLQIFSRYTELIPSYIWTEEMARFLFIWMVVRSGRRDLRLAQESFVLAPAQAQRMGFDPAPRAQVVVGK